MATAGYVSKTAVTTTATNPSASDVGGTITAASLNLTRDELETNYQGSTYKSFILGMSSSETPISGDWDSTDPVCTRLRAAFLSGDTVYVHILPNGSTGDRVPVKVSGFNMDFPPDGKVTYSATVRGVGALASVTLS